MGPITVQRQWLCKYRVSHSLPNPSFL